MSCCWCILLAPALCQSHETKEKPLKLVRVWSKWAQSQRLWFLARKIYIAAQVCSSYNVHFSQHLLAGEAAVVQLSPWLSPASHSSIRTCWVMLGPPRSYLLVNSAKKHQLHALVSTKEAQGKTKLQVSEIEGWELSQASLGTTPSSSWCYLQPICPNPSSSLPYSMQHHCESWSPHQTIHSLDPLQCAHTAHHRRGLPVGLSLLLTLHSWKAWKQTVILLLIQAGCYYTPALTNKWECF